MKHKANNFGRHTTGKEIRAWLNNIRGAKAAAIRTRLEGTTLAPVFRTAFGT